MSKAIAVKLRKKTGLNKKEFARFINAKSAKKVDYLESKLYDNDTIINLFFETLLNCDEAYNYIEKRYIGLVL